MSLDVNSFQQIIHDAPLWAQYAAQGLAADAVTGTGHVAVLTTAYL